MRRTPTNGQHPHLMLFIHLVPLKCWSLNISTEMSTSSDLCTGRDSGSLSSASGCWFLTTMISNNNHRNENDVRTDRPISSEEVSIRQILAGSLHILQLTEEVQVVLVKVEAEELSGHVRTLNNQLTGEDRSKRQQTVYAPDKSIQQLISTSGSTSKAAR